jgi:hypothetical protein
LYKFCYLFPYDFWTSYLARISFIQGKHMWQQLRLFWQEFPCQQLVFPFILWISSLAMFSYNSRTLEAVLNFFFLLHIFTLTCIIFYPIVEIRLKFNQKILKTLFYIQLKFYNDRKSRWPCNKI